MDKGIKTIDEYLTQFPEDVKNKLQSIREAIAEEAPDAVEAISYQMPTFKLGGKNLVHFAGFKDHLSLFPTASKLEDHLPEVVKYRTGKGTLQFSLDQELPMKMIRKIVQIRVSEVKSS